MDSHITRKALAWTVGMTLVVYALLWAAAGAPLAVVVAHVVPTAWQSSDEDCAPALR